MKSSIYHTSLRKRYLPNRCLPLLALILALLIPLLPLTAEAAPAAPQITTRILPEAVAGEPYIAKVLCSDPDAELTLVDDPGQDNNFSKTGLTFSKDGTISGIPTGAGLYYFVIVATGAGGEDYRMYTLFVSGDSHVTATTPTLSPTEPVATEPPPTEPEPVATEPPTEPATEPATTRPAPTEPASQPATAPTETTPTEPEILPVDPLPPSFPRWAGILIGLATIGIAVSVVILIRKRK